jgi:putative endonuclease
MRLVSCDVHPTAVLTSQGDPLALREPLSQNPTVLSHGCHISSPTASADRRSVARVPSDASLPRGPRGPRAPRDPSDASVPSDPRDSRAPRDPRAPGAPRAPRDPRARLGRLGERLALEHYARLGFRVLERNYRVRGGELDLIVYDGRTIVFVEVKTRRAGGWDPLESITQAKQRRLRVLAATWLSAQVKPPRANEFRFDAVGVVVDGRGRLVALDQREAVL